MALIFCPECGAQVSDQAETCNKCSYPISKLNFIQTENSKVNSTQQSKSVTKESTQIIGDKENPDKTLYIILGVVLILIIGGFILFKISSQDKLESFRDKFTEIIAATEPLIGKWERYGDEFEGLIVEVKQSGEILEGTIIHNCSNRGCEIFFNGEISWKDIKKIEDGKYQTEHLVKHINYYGKLDNAFYDPAKLTLIDENHIEERLYNKRDRDELTLYKYRKKK